MRNAIATIRHNDGSGKRIALYIRRECSNKHWQYRVRADHDRQDTGLTAQTFEAAKAICAYVWAAPCWDIQFKEQTK